MARAIIPYDGYPAPDGAKLKSAGDFFGSNNYQAGGYSVTAAAFGMYGRVEYLSFAPLTQSANYYARWQPTANSSNATEQRATAYNSVTVKWYAANGTEVANNSNLSLEVIPYQVWGS